jgi:hypothetical protein
MKPKKIFLAVAVFAAMHIAGARQVDFSAPANFAQGNNVWIEKSQPKLITPFSKSTPTSTGEIMHAGKLDSRPWAQTGDRDSGMPAPAYNELGTRESQLHLLTINF